MKFSDMCLALLIVLIFIGLYAFSIISVGLKKVKKDWPQYRCNPIVMPFASQFGADPMQNFTHCIGNMQSSSMDFFLQPIHYVTSLLGNLGGDLTTSINNVRNIIAYIRSMVSNITGDIFGVFLNILIQVQRITINLKDLVMKIVGVLTTILYVMGSSMKLGESIWSGEIGGIIRTLCFKSTTQIKLNSGKMVNIKNINLGDTLENGTMVVGTLNLKGDKHNPYYKIWSKTLEEYIYVTGEHHIFPPLSSDDKGKLKNYIKVKNYKPAIKTTEYDDVLHCLVTTNHNIPVGEYTFWDWED
jgi:hypothetical protein